MNSWFIFAIVTIYNKEYNVDKHTSYTYNIGTEELKYLNRIFANKHKCADTYGCYKCAYFKVLNEDYVSECILYETVRKIRALK